MPRSPKIVPAYTSAHTATYINDNSGVRPLVMPQRPVIDTSLKTLCIFGSEKGLDNTLMYVPPAQWARYQNWFGIPNFNKFGQCALHPYHLLTNNPNTGVWCMRVLPDDAAYANGIVVAHFGLQNVTEEVPNGSGGLSTIVHKEFQIMYTVESYLPDGTDLGCLSDFGDFNSLDVAQKEWTRLPPLSTDENGWYHLPIAVIRPAGHGKYGNKYSFRFERDLSAEKERNMKMFRLSILDSFQATVYKSSYRGSFVNSTVGQRVSSFEDNILDMGQDANIMMRVYPDNVEYIFSQYQEYLKTIDINAIPGDKERKVFEYSNQIIVDQFDPIFGCMIGNNTPLHGLHIIDEPLAMYNNAAVLDPRYMLAANIKLGAGQKLNGGTDGSFDKPPLGQTFQEVYDEELVKAFQGAKDGRIIDKYRIPFEFIFDANYTFAPDDEAHNVKGAMFALNNARCRNKYDVPDTGAGCQLFLDAGQKYTDITTQIGNNNRTDPEWTYEMNSELLTLTRSFSMFDNRITSAEFQHGQVYDPFTNRRITVTPTWNLVKKYIPMLQNKDIMIPFAGKDVAIWDDIIPGTLYPSLSNIDMDIKEELETQRFNYYQYDGGAETGSEIVVRMSQNTRQPPDNDLGNQGGRTSLVNENNMVVMNAYVKGVEEFNRGKLWTFNDKTNQKSFTDELNSRYKGWEGVKCETLSTYFTADREDQLHDILRCYSAMVFRNLNKVIIHEIDVNLPEDLPDGSSSDII